MIDFLTEASSLGCGGGEVMHPPPALYDLVSTQYDICRDLSRTPASARLCTAVINQ